MNSHTITINPPPAWSIYLDRDWWREVERIVGGPVSPHAHSGLLDRHYSDGTPAADAAADYLREAAGA
jgi:hypothetical protein